MKVHTFLGKVTIEGLHQMDHQINDWLRRNEITPVHIKQSFGMERHHGSNEEPIVIVTIWFEPGDED